MQRCTPPLQQRVVAGRAKSLSDGKVSVLQRQSRQQRWLLMLCRFKHKNKLPLDEECRSIVYRCMMDDQEKTRALECHRTHEESSHRRRLCEGKWGEKCLFCAEKPLCLLAFAKRDTEAMLGQHDLREVVGCCSIEGAEY